MKHTTHIKSKFSCLLLLLTSCVLFIACQSKPNTIESHNTAQKPTVEPTTTQESIPPTMTTMPTDTTIPATITPTPQPTLTRAEKEALAVELYTTNAGCEFPCWWGIIPGETKWQTAKLFLSTIATTITTGTQSESDSVFVAEVDIPVPESLSQYGFLRQTFFVRDGTILNIDLEGPWGTRNIGTVSEILNNYGPPADVLLDTFGYVFHAGDSYPFHIVLFYPEKGMLIRYFDEAELTDDYLIGCIQKDSGTPMLWSPNLELTFIEALGRQNSAQYYKSLEETTEMDLEIFYQTYLDPNTEICIETPIELWQDR